MMIAIRSRNHLRVHVTAQAQLQPYLPPHDLGLDVLGHADHVADPLRAKLQQSPQLLRRAARRLGEVEGDEQALLRGALEGGPKDGDIACGWVPAEVDADDTLGPVLQSERDNFEGGGGVVAPVDGEGQVGFHAGGGAVRAGEDVLEVVIFGDVRGRDRAWCGAKFEVDYAVGFEVVDNRLGGVDDGVLVVMSAIYFRATASRRWWWLDG